jgi:hypothetical protein
MADIFSNIKNAKKTALRLARRNADVTSSENKRDVCLYKYLEKIYEIDQQLRNMTLHQGRQTLQARYVKLPTNRNPAMIAMKLTGLDDKTCSKYANLLRFVRNNKKPTDSVRSCVQAHGGINRCLREERKQRVRKKKSRRMGRP